MISYVSGFLVLGEGKALQVNTHIITLLLFALIPSALLNFTDESKVHETIPDISEIGIDMIRDESVYVDNGINGKQKSTGRKESIVNPYTAYSYENMIRDSNRLYEAHPDIIKIDCIGKSVEDRDIILIKLGKGNKKILLNGCHHAREYISTTLLMKIIDEYSKAFSRDEDFEGYDIKGLLNEFTIYFVPMVNPDGVNLVLNGVGSVKNPARVKGMYRVYNSYRAWKSNINGVDLNRNYPVLWEKINNGFLRPSSEKFKGYSKASEPETRAIMKLCRNNDFILAMAYHAKGEVIYWADRGTYNLIPQAGNIANRLSKLTGYTKLPVSQKPSDYAGGFENWFRAEYKKPAFCIELSPYNGDLPHPDSEFDKLVWNKAKKTGLFFLLEAKSMK
jgi:predicted deacylase